ncbi:hypothetical protein EPJ90_06605 [Erysipelothrix sp. strain 2 (EsS2-7-Brazil)]|uniref:hypothetical protein n=1 Tax=Erysipelothrix sp. strain 2 (EsS2-7-Brazil) TaxID=2500579 RepID=UPI00190B79A6|nr:hypothetical protein [Erysipelothrix sp. strain 2 (EsS2-7-Brazil)]MBK2404499.1 hypothetical protein [Erysipelothrix sp. strain 2 (EsS2-7-Brazil)]
MKKIITAALIVLVLVSGCSKSNKPNDEQKAKLNEASDRLMNANAIDMDLTLEMKPEKREQLNDAVSANMEIQYAKAKLPLDFDLIFKINIPDEDDTSMNFYKKGTDVYMDFMEQKMKIDLKQIPQVGMFLELPFNDVQSEPADINFEKATVVSENNQLVYTFDLNDFLQSDTFKKALAEQGQDVDLDFKQGQAIVKVGDEIETIDLSFMVTEKNSMESLEMLINIEVVGLNDSVEMSFPNFDTFIDMTQLYQ